MKPESNRVEYKRQLTDKFERSVSPFWTIPVADVCTLASFPPSWPYFPLRMKEQPGSVRFQDSRG